MIRNNHRYDQVTSKSSWSSRTARTYLKINSMTDAIFLTIQVTRAIISISRRVQRSVDALLLIEQLTRIIMSASWRDRRSIVTNKWSSLEQVVQRERIWSSIAHLAFSIMTRSELNVFCRCNSFDRTTDSIVQHHDLMSLTLCCLLSRTYDAWRTESCQNHLQRLLLDLTERWVLWMWMWDEVQEIEKDFEVWCIQCDRDYDVFRV